MSCVSLVSMIHVTATTTSHQMTHLDHVIGHSCTHHVTPLTTITSEPSPSTTITTSQSSPPHHSTSTTHLDHVIELVSLRIEGSSPNLSTLVQQVQAEELALALRVTPGPHVALAGDPHANSPPVTHQ